MVNKEDIVAFVLDGQSLLEYHRSQALPESQKMYLDDMDSRMNKGFELSGEQIVRPDQQAKNKFVALSLVAEIKQDNFQLATALFSYLVDRMPDLKQVKAMSKDGKIGVEFVFDEIKGPGQKINFMPGFKTH